MTPISVEEIKRNVSVYLNRVEAGETLVIEENGKPFAEIKPLTQAARKDYPGKLRPIGLCEGEFIVPDNFHDCCIIEEFEG